MKIAAAQTQSGRDPRENGAMVQTQMREAAAAGARLVLFTEGVLSGYALKDEETDWAGVAVALEQVRTLARELKLWTVVGCSHRVEGKRPFNSVYVVSDAGEIAARYDKRLCSNNEISNYYSAGAGPVVFDAEGFRFGLVLCLEVCFPELFMEYERLGVDCVLFPAASSSEEFNLLARGHAAANCYWVAVSTPTKVGGGLAAGVIGPDGTWLEQLGGQGEAGVVVSVLDRGDPRFDVALNKARPWRRLAREGGIYRR